MRPAGVRVALDLEADLPQEILSYSLPEEMPVPPLGAYVLVTLKNRPVTGFVVGYEEETHRPLQPILALLSPTPYLSSKEISLGRWISERYLCRLISALRLFVPDPLTGHIQRSYRALGDKEPCRLSPTARKLWRYLRERDSPVPFEELLPLGGPSCRRLLDTLVKKGYILQEYQLTGPRSLAPLRKAFVLREDSPCFREATELRSSLTLKQRLVLSYLKEKRDPVLATEIKSALGITDSILKTLEQKGWIERVEIPLPRRPYSGVPSPPEKPLLSPQQEKALSELVQALENEEEKKFLLFGVTASGKTEVYLRALEYCLGKGRQGILLVPEISLTPQMMEAVRSRFGEQSALLHSALSPGERWDEWRRIRRGQARVIVGARSALFAPVEDLGLIILDEEHETAYKQETQPRYHAREVSAKRANLSQAVLLLGSATPSVETFFWAERGFLHLLEMPERVASRPLPQVQLVDMRSEKAPPPIFSKTLVEEIQKTLSRGQQVILFLNRLGYAPLLLCPDCGYTFRCPHCSVSLTYHSALHQLRCHHCDYRRRVPSLCHRCQGTRLRLLGVGTERVEEETRRLFPSARILRLDSDTTSRKGAYHQILRAFREKEAQILIGTQMVAKGLDFPQVTLVGVISADLTLNMPDFRASERTFQLLMQVSGRAGRGEDPGKVLIQTFNPDHYSLQAICQHDYRGFYHEEIRFRQDLGYPPFSRLANLIAVGSTSQSAKALAEKIYQALKQKVGDSQEIILLGPAPAPLERIKGRYRWHLLLKAKRISPLLSLLQQGLESLNSTERKLVTVDIDPVSLL